MSKKPKAPPSLPEKLAEWVIRLELTVTWDEKGDYARFHHRGKLLRVMWSAAACEDLKHFMGLDPVEELQACVIWELRNELGLQPDGPNFGGEVGPYAPVKA